MALGATLITGRPPAFAVVPGILNASAAMLLAYRMGAPVVALVGQIPSFAIDQDHGHPHEIHDQLGLLRHITRQPERIRAPWEASELVAWAIAVVMSGRIRCVQAQANGNRVIASDLTNPDFVGFARSFGMTAFRATSSDALEDVSWQAFALNAPVLVHVPIREMPSPWDMILLPRVCRPRGRLPLS